MVVPIAWKDLSTVGAYAYTWIDKGYFPESSEKGVAVYIVIKGDDMIATYACMAIY